MNSRHVLLLPGLASLLVACTAVQAADAVPVLAPAKRAPSLTAAQALLEQKPAELPAEPADPFHSPAFIELAAPAMRAISAPPGAGATAESASAPNRPAGPRSEQELLAALAAAPLLKPSGLFDIGGQPLLVFGQKRVKAGGTLTINFEGAEYTLEIVAITRTNFTIRLNHAEFTRPIK